MGEGDHCSIELHMLYRRKKWYIQTSYCVSNLCSGWDTFDALFWRSAIARDVPRRLTHGSGQPVANGSYDLNFRIDDASAGGNTFWHETQNGVPVTDGLFTVVLGSVNSPSPKPDESIFGIRCAGSGSQSIVTRRNLLGLDLTTVSYAFRVATVDSAREEITSN